MDAAGPAETAGDAADASDPLTAALEGARRGDSESFRILYRETQPRLLRYLRYHVAAEAEDIASEAWLQVSRDLPKFEGDYDNFRRWVTTIARNRAIDHVRRTARQPPAVLLRVVAGLTARGAARVAGKRTGAIRTAAYRGLKRLAKRMERANRQAANRAQP